MHRLRRLSHVAVLLVLAAVLSSCLASGVYRTARTLGEGEGDLNLTFSATRFTTDEQKTVDQNGQTKTEPGTDVTIPNLIPELAYHIGLTDDFEVGGRAALGSMLLEADAKYRFLQHGNLHLAVAPALGFRSLGVIEGPSMALPLIATFDLSDAVGVNFAPYVSYSSLSATDSDAFDNLSGSFMSTGASLGFQFRGRTAHFMPSVDFSQSLTRFDADSADTQRHVTKFLIVSLSMGWVSGREMKKLERMDDKLDRIERKLDSKATPPAPAVSPTPAVPAAAPLASAPE